MTPEERLEMIVWLARNAQTWHGDQADALLAHLEIIEKVAADKDWNWEG